MKEDQRRIKRDMILAISLLAATGLSYIGMRLFRSDGRYAVVYENQEEIARYALSVDSTSRIQTDKGINVLVIRDGKAAVTEADCPDSVCIRMGEISKNGETIVCLPHKLVIQIEE